MNSILGELPFPHDQVRPIQEDMITDIYKALELKQDILMHAPTGIGKTASALAPALHYADQNKLTVFFLTSRHTQHHIVIDTLKEIKAKHGLNIEVADLIGKKGMCAQPQIDIVPTGEFHEYCKTLREDKQCEFYLNTKNPNGQLSVEAKKTLGDLKADSPCHIEHINHLGSAAKLCPYELAIEMAKTAQVIVCDYYYIFNEGIRQSFFTKTEKELAQSLIIVDEAHNVPGRIRKLASVSLSDFVLDQATREARKFGADKATEHLEKLTQAMKSLEPSESEQPITKEQLVMLVGGRDEYEEMTESLLAQGDAIREENKRSFVASVGNFLERWTGEDQGFCRIMSSYQNKWTLSYKCLDPSIHSGSIIEGAHATILMSGTLKPTHMYHDLLGFDHAVQKEYPNPFPKENRLTLVVPKTTTKYAARSESQFKDIAVMCAGLLESIPGKTAIFFPSYYIRDKVFAHLSQLFDTDYIVEKPGLSKQAKKVLVEQLVSGKIGTFVGVSAGSFGEGLDMPGVLKGVIIVGLPLNRPDLETKSLIEYYDKKFGRGWDYGYVYPAITTTLQNAGRCIRSEKDKGVMVFLDERYAWPSYRQCFPKDWELHITTNFPDLLADFFRETKIKDAAKEGKLISFRDL